MFTQPKDLIGRWSGLIVHQKAAVHVQVRIDKIQADGSLHGIYSFPNSKPSEPGGQLTCDLYGPWLFVRLSDGDAHGKIHFHAQIIGENGPEMIYGAIPRPHQKAPHSTITLFPARRVAKDLQILRIWQTFFRKGK